jgi:Tfp pilus assembly protein PilO
VAALVLYFVAYPIYQSAQDINQQIENKKAEETALKQRLEDLKELENNYNEAKDKAEKASDALPTNKEEPNLLVQLENIAGDSDMGFAEIAPNDKSSTTSKNKTSSSTGTKSSGSTSSGTSATTNTSSSGLYRELPMTVKVTGSFAGLLKYLNGIEKNLRLLDISSISISKDATNKTLGIDLAVKAYFQNKK